MTTGHIRRSLGLVTVLIVAGFAAVWTEDSSALAPPTPPEVVNLPANWGKVYGLMQQPATAEGVGGAASGEARGILYRARTVAGTLPKLKVLGTMTLATTAFAVGWNIGRTIDRQWQYAIDATGGSGSTATLGPVNNTRVKFDRWRWLTAGASSPTHGASYTIPSDGWYAQWFECSSGPSCTPTGQSEVFANTSCPCPVRDIVTGWGSAAQRVQGGDVYFLRKSEEEMEALVKPVASAPFVAQPVGVTTNNFPFPADPGEGSGLADTIRDTMLEGSDSADVEIAKMIDPTFESLEILPGTLTLPAPGANETLELYLQRLREAGWLGTAIIIDYSDDPLPGYPEYDPRYGPKVPTLIESPSWGPIGTPTLGYPSGDPDIDTPPVTWPENPPVVTPDEPITFTRNPPTTVEVPVPLVPPVDPGNGGGECNCPPFDLGPITGIDYGDKFPFGFSVWAVDMLSDTDDVCPMFTVQPPVELSDEPIEISLCNDEWESAYQEPVFLVVKFLMTLGAIWFVCTRILGIGGGDDSDD